MKNIKSRPSVPRALQQVFDFVQAYDVFGSALAAEGIFPFFLVSSFLALLFFGWGKISRKVHFLRPAWFASEYPPQSSILQTEVAVAVKVEEIIFARGLASVPKPADTRKFVEGQLYKPEYASLG